MRLTIKGAIEMVKGSARSMGMEIDRLRYEKNFKKKKRNS